MQKWAQLWYQRSRWLWLLRPLALLFCVVASARRLWYRIFRPKPFSVPVIVVGNIVVGGSGKTPLLIALAQQLKQWGFRPGIVSRGYGAHPPCFPHQVLKGQNAVCAGDEPLLIARATGCPVVIDPKRVRAVDYLLTHMDCTVVLSDDGLQHYAMHRDVELVVVDGQRRFGNGWCLPAGPLREPVSRLKTVDAVISNGGVPQGNEYEMQLQPLAWINVLTGQQQSLEFFKGQRLHMVAGIGNPGRFFQQVQALGGEGATHDFPDHHAYGVKDLQFGDDLPVVMTEKDAVKCQGFAQQHWWYLSVTAVLEVRLLDHLHELLRKKHG